MPKAAITVSKSLGESGYRVSCGKLYDMTRVFLWGDFDECSITWQEARSQAMRYANDWALASRRKLKINI